SSIQRIGGSFRYRQAHDRATDRARPSSHRLHRRRSGFQRRRRTPARSFASHGRGRHQTLSRRARFLYVSVGAGSHRAPAWLLSRVHGHHRVQRRHGRRRHFYRPSPSTRGARGSHRRRLRRHTDRHHRIAGHHHRAPTHRRDGPAG